MDESAGVLVMQRMYLPAYITPSVSFKIIMVPKGNILYFEYLFRIRTLLLLFQIRVFPYTNNLAIVLNYIQSIHLGGSTLYPPIP